MNTPCRKPEIAVVGAGWTGLSAALSLAGHADVTLFEAGRTAGGRARTLAGETDGFRFLDNGQHILLGAYRRVLSLMERIGANPETAFLRQPLQWHMHGGLQFQTASLPPPLHILAGVLRAKNIGLPLKIKLLTDMAALQRYAHGGCADMGVGTWLQQRNAPQYLIDGFWQPLVWGALNTPLEHASLRVLCHVLSDGVWADKSGSDYLIPKRDLGSIFAEPAVDMLRKLGAEICFEKRICRLKPRSDGRVEADGGIFDAVIIATAPYHAVKLLPENTRGAVLDFYAALRYHAVTTVYLRYNRPVRLPAAMTGLADGTAQWFVSRAALGLPENEVAAVVSVSDHVGAFDAQTWADKVHADLKRICPDLDAPEAVRTITEKRATAASLPHAVLPNFSGLNRQGIYLAGDYLHPRYPATLEAAVQSGEAAAEICLKHLNAKNAV